tara:strand:+ start:93088 stop:93543 length:456 start_codon:yes stop_codon:yes gene_type:complete
MSTSTAPWSYTTDHFSELGFTPLNGEGIYTDLVELFKLDKKEFTGAKNGDSSITDRVGLYILENVGLLARMIKPDGTFRPEWFHEDVQRPFESLIERDEFAEYTTVFSEIHEIDSDIAGAISLYIATRIQQYEDRIYEFYSLPVPTHDDDE